jgi:hypothetical protein
MRPVFQERIAWVLFKAANNRPLFERDCQKNETAEYNASTVEDFTCENGLLRLERLAGSA